MNHCTDCNRDFDGETCPRCRRRADELHLTPGIDMGIGFDESFNPTVGVAPGVSVDIDGGGLNILGISTGALGSVANGIGSAAGTVGGAALDAAGTVGGAALDVAGGAAVVAGDVLGVAGDVLGGVAEVAVDLVDGLDV